MPARPLASDSSINDAELARRIAGDDEAAFETLMRRHNGALFRVARAILKNEAVDETAACLSIPEATVRSRTFRARGMLRESLARDLDMAAGDVFRFGGERCDRIVAGVLARFRAFVAAAASPPST